MNWADYSRFVGNVFGSLLAAEGVFAFFLEGGFLGLMLFGGNRLGPRLWLFAIFMVVFGAHFSALWILMANSWMQTPARLRDRQHRAVMTDFWQVVFTPSFIPRLLHVWAASWTVGAALMCSVSAWYLLKKRHVELAKSNLKAALPVFVLFAVLNVFVFGANMAIEVTNQQPLKLASMEGLCQSKSCAPDVRRGLGRHHDADDERDLDPVPAQLPRLPGHPRHGPGHRFVRPGADPADQPRVPGLSPHDHDGTGVGRDRGAGRADVPVEAAALRVPLRPVAAGAHGVHGEATITAGWWTAEIGRQPWVVYNVLATADGVSPTLSATDVVLSLGMFIVLYALLGVLFLYLLNRKIQDGPDELEDVETVAVSNLPDTFRDVFSRSRRAADLGDEP